MPSVAQQSCRAEGRLDSKGGNEQRMMPIPK
jgi:hypothetical protein